jgi:hypothetical protein
VTAVSLFSLSSSLQLAPGKGITKLFKNQKLNFILRTIKYSNYLRLKNDCIFLLNNKKSKLCSKTKFLAGSLDIF